MPKLTLVQGIWWSTYYKNDWNGFITNINKVTFKDVNNADVQITTGSLLNKNEEGGKENLTFFFFPVPLLTSRITLQELTYTVNPRGSNPLPNFDEGHYILFEVELVGCDNYVLNEGDHQLQNLFSMTKFLSKLL